MFYLIWQSKISKFAIIIYYQHFFFLECFIDMDNYNADTYRLITDYFPALPPEIPDAFARLGGLYRSWNERINVVSRADTDNIYCRHVLHSLALAKFFGELEDGTTLMDLGTGGGFPGIPMAMLYPRCRFHLIDRIGKKIKVANAIAEEIGLRNVTFQHGDSGECHERFDYVISRAVMPLDGLVKACSKNIVTVSRHNNRYAPGLACLKGGDLRDEIKAVRRPVVEVPVSDFFSEPFFETKEIVYVPFVK